MASDHQRALSPLASPVIFPDTNIFLHYTFFTEIPWDTIVGAAHVSLAIAPVTISEIDSHKYTSSSTRVRDRAQKVTKKLGELVDSAGIVRPNVMIEFIDHEPVDFDRHQLVRSSQDDQLLATILEYKEKYPDRKPLLVTNDIGLKIKAKSRGIHTLPLAESYILRESDPNEKRVKELERKVLELQSQAPSLKVVFSNESDRIEIPRPPLFTDETTFIEQRMRKIKADYSKLEVPSGRVNALEFLSLSSQSIREYNTQLDAFFQKFKEYLSACYRIKETRSRAAQIEFNVKNFGSGTGIDIKVFLRLPLTVDLKAGREWQQLPRKPEPPKKPDPRDFLRPSYLGGFASSRIPSLYDIPNIPQMLAEPRVVWRKPKRDGSSWIVSFEVSKLNHGYSEPCPRDVYIVFPSVDTFASFNISYEITAGNLPSKSTGDLHFIVKD